MVFAMSTQPQGLLHHREGLASQFTKMHLPRFSRYEVGVLRDRLSPVPETPLDNLLRLRQRESLAEFNAEFDLVSSKTNLSEAFLVKAYVSALKDDIIDSVRMFNPRSMLEARRLARLQEISLQRQNKKTPLLIKNEPHIQECVTFPPKNSNAGQESAGEQENSFEHVFKNGSPFAPLFSEPLSPSKLKKCLSSSLPSAPVDGSDDCTVVDHRLVPQDSFAAHLGSIRCPRFDFQSQNNSNCTLLQVKAGSCVSKKNTEVAYKARTLAEPLGCTWLSKVQFKTSHSQIAGRRKKKGVMGIGKIFISQTKSSTALLPCIHWSINRTLICHQLPTLCVNLTWFKGCLIKMLTGSSLVQYMMYLVLVLDNIQWAIT